MPNKSLKNIIQELIELRIEGDYWDFKAKWHENNADLLHDIICMANNIVNRDAYIIIGVTDSKSQNGVQIVGVPADNRKNQQNLIDFLKDKSFAGDVRPTVYVETIMIEQEIDVIIIQNTIKVPYYLIEPYHFGKECVQSGHVYVRIGDTNTPKNKCADIDKVEYLWRKRFGLNMTPIQQLGLLLDDPDSWEGNFTSSDMIYHQLYPQYRIQLIETDEDFKDNIILNNIADHNPDKHFAARKIKVYYNTTILYQDDVIYFDGYRHMIPFPDTNTIYQPRSHDLKKSLTYLYFDLSTIKGKLFNCLAVTKNNWYNEKWDLIVGVAFLQFKNIEEKEDFDDYVLCNLDTVLEEYEQAIKKKKYPQTKGTESYYQFGYSKANEIKARFLYDKYRGGEDKVIDQYLPHTKFSDKE